MKITIMRDQLVAALCIAAKSDIRYYLNGVHVEATNTETRLTATNGHVLLTQRADAKGDNQVDGTVRMTLPRAAIEGIKKHKQLPTIEINDDGGNWGIVDGPACIAFTPVEGRFPDYRRIFPKTTDGVAVQFDPALVACFAKAAVALGATSKGRAEVHLSHNGATGCALVTFGGKSDAVGVLMGMRGQPESTPPGWVFDLLEEPA